MGNRRISGAVLVLVLMAMVFPTASEARIQADLGGVSVDIGLLERLEQLWAWAESVLAELEAPFTSNGGASITSGG